MNLVRFKKRTKDLHLPDGRIVKVTINDANTTQHVEELDGRTHATAKPAPIVVAVRRYQPPKIRQAFQHDEDINLWVPVPDPEEMSQ